MHFGARALQVLRCRYLGKVRKVREEAVLSIFDGDIEMGSFVVGIGGGQYMTVLEIAERAGYIGLSVRIGHRRGTCWTSFEDFYNDTKDVCKLERILYAG